MPELIKIIVTDSSGGEHIFNETPGEIENYLELRPLVNDSVLKGAIRIVTRIFSDEDVADYETHSLFISPRRVDVIYEYN